MCSVQLIFSILHHNPHFKGFHSCDVLILRVHVSAQYKVMLQISVFTILFLRYLFNLLLNNYFLLKEASIDILLLISLWHRQRAYFLGSRNSLNCYCAPSYLRDLSCPVSVLTARRMLRSATRGEFLVLRARLAITQRREFSVVGPSAWNDLPFELRSLLMAHPSKFYISLKSLFFVRDWAGSISE